MRVVNNCVFGTIIWKEKGRVAVKKYHRVEKLPKPSCWVALNVNESKECDYKWVKVI